jgi:hypothetical protein
MWIFVLEAVVALAMLVLIIWLTLGGSSRRDADGDGAPPRKLDSDRDQN